jgi:hypothetical protein
MLEGEDWEKITPFDRNELWILYASLAMYVAEIQITKNPDTAKLGICLQLCNHFNTTLEANR